MDTRDTSTPWPSVPTASGPGLCQLGPHVRIWLADGRAGLTLRGHTETVTSVAYRPDGRRLASAGEDAAIKVWEPNTDPQAVVLKDFGRPIRCIAYSLDGRYLAAGDSRAAVGSRFRSGTQTGAGLRSPFVAKPMTSSP